MSKWPEQITATTGGRASEPVSMGYRLAHSVSETSPTMRVRYPTQQWAVISRLSAANCTTPIFFMNRFEAAQALYNQGLENVRTKPEPAGQKFKCGSRVKIASDLGPGMSHFTGGVEATVLYTYAHAYGGTNVKSYCLDIPGEGSVSWYHECQLTAL